MGDTEEQIVALIEGASSPSLADTPPRPLLAETAHRDSPVLRALIENDAAARPPAFSDDAIADLFAEQHRNDLRFVAVWRKWLRLEGSRWRYDDTLKAFDLVRHTCRDVAKDCGKGKIK